MARAEVGDDVYGEDPTVRRLEEMAAERLGKQAATFVPSGTMANQIALRIQTRHGDTVLAGRGAHVFLYEGGAAAGLWGVHIRQVGQDGFFQADDVRRAVPPDDPHYARLSLVALENTHNSAGGRVWPLSQLRAVARTAADHGLRLHLDGARLFNAAVSSGIDAAQWAEPFDTVSFCLSKGLGAPVGSLLCGSTDLVAEARRARKMLGGGMRQAGIVAAGGIYALEHHVDRLAEDHANATLLARGLAERGIAVDREPETNILMCRLPNPAEFARQARKRGVLVLDFDEERVRAVTHLGVSAADVAEALRRIDEIPLA